MSTELSCEIVTARKRHQCSLCTAYIEPGEKYQRETFVDDGLFASFLTCQPCLVDNVAEHADRMFGYDDGVDDEIAYEWAIDRTSYPDGVPADEIAAAWRLIDRHLAEGIERGER
ncbi:hypothetical protein [uncultured Tessaracoccus sp.]|uniref:hypothetical protein n=1 Tax=uncultured Tessaracoccus sp. TaxID=905023 RepID=UPI00260CAA5B|nr:hypothetical protein [uncultured Tessaracoccus sp.]